MVQRKDPNKLGIQADSKDDVKSDKWLLALKPSSSQHQDIQDKGGTESKKKEMKKSRSIKLLDLENLESVPTRRAKSRFNKPTTSSSTAAANPQLPSQSNKRDPSSNYMRPTSSFDAKKELSQVNPHGYLASCSRKSLSPKPTGRSSCCKSPTQGPSSARTYPHNLSSSGVRSSHCKRLSEGNSNHMSPSPNPGGRNTTQNSSTPSPDGREFNSPSFSPSLRGRYSNTKLCSGSDHKPVKTLTKTPSLKPVRTLTKTPSSLKGGAELKKQMKKSRSIKLLALETFEPSSVEQTNSSFDESPGTISSVSVTQVNEHLMMTPDLLPNYMKPTSSSDAKKEQSQVSTKGSQTTPSKNPNESSLIRRKPSSASGYKPARTLAKTSSLKPVRTLTKTSSLKLQRSSIKNRPDIVSCSSLTAGRATCSSTLKDSKFPTFLTLSSGATESEGTSAMKVCPYTYCSLNGHHHKQLPLLKPFLSARRFLLKRQKSLRMKSLSPLQNKPPGKSKRDIKRDMVAFYEDPTAAAAADLAPTVKPPAIKEDDIDFFVEIYALPSEDTATPMGRSIQDGNDGANTDCTVNSDIPVGITSSFIYGIGIETEDYDGNVHESMLNELSYSDISFEYNIDQNTDPEAGLDIQTCQQDQFIQIANTNYNSSLAIAEPGTKYCIGKDLEEESTRDTELEESSLELTDMNWEGNSAPPCDESDFMTLHVTEFKRPMLEEELASKTDESINKGTEEFPLEGLAQQQIHTEDTESLTMEYSYDDSGTDIEDNSSERGIPINFSSGSSGISNFSDQILFSSTTHKEPATITEEVDGIPKSDMAFNSVVYFASVENQLDALTASSDEKNEVPESENLLQEFILITEVIGEAPVKEQESSLVSTNNCVRVDAGDDAEGKEQAEDTIELDGYGGKSSHAENSIGEEKTMQVEGNVDSNATEKINSEANITSPNKDEKIVIRGNSFNQLPMTSVNLKRTIRCRRPIDEQDEPRKFNPKEPQFLDTEPEPEPEKVDLRHQMMDGRKNAEEWMLDYALQQAVTKLAPARKRKVSLLVEAFEAVIPPKCESRLPNSSAAFAHARSIQACN